MKNVALTIFAIFAFFLFIRLAFPQTTARDIYVGVSYLGYVVIVWIAYNLIKPKLR